MSASFAQYLVPAAASAPAALISAAAFREIESIVAPLPSSFAQNTFGFEVRLGEDAPLADVLVQATAKHGRAELAHVGGEGDAWTRVRELGAAWKDDVLLRERLDYLWLEFDSANGGRTPSAFFGFHTDDRPTTEARLAATHAALELLVRPYPRETIERVFTQSPGELEVFQIGAMLGRGASPVRLCLRARDAESLRDCSCAPLVAMLAPITYYFCVDVDVDDHGVRPRVGLECYGDAAALLDVLVREKLCTPAKRDALLAWRGVTPSSRDAWPAELLDAESFLGTRARSVLARSVHHVKVVWDQRPVEAKAYLACDYQWM